MEKIYTNARELFEDTWKYGSLQEKKKLLKANNSSLSWAVTKSPQEMVNRGGGLVVTRLGRVFDKYLELHPGLKINWKDRQ